MIADPCFDADAARPSRNHAVSVLLRHAVLRAGEVSRGAPQRPASSEGGPLQKLLRIDSHWTRPSQELEKRRSR
jgi:hypothetical protein